MVSNNPTLDLIKYFIDYISVDGTTFNDTKYNFEKKVKKLFNAKTKILGIKLPFTTYFICYKTLTQFLKEKYILDTNEDYFLYFKKCRNYKILKLLSMYKFLSQTPSNCNYTHYDYIYTDTNDIYDDVSFTYREISNIINNKDCNEIVYALEKLFYIENINFLPNE
jgi:hypothetical protein